MINSIISVNLVLVIFAAILPLILYYFKIYRGFGLLNTLEKEKLFDKYIKSIFQNKTNNYQLALRSARESLDSLSTTDLNSMKLVLDSKEKQINFFKPVAILISFVIAFLWYAINSTDSDQKDNYSFLQNEIQLYRNEINEGIQKKDSERLQYLITTKKSYIDELMELWEKDAIMSKNLKYGILLTFVTTFMSVIFAFYKLYFRITLLKSLVDQTLQERSHLNDLFKIQNNDHQLFKNHT